MPECVVLQGCIPVSWPAHFMFLLHRSCISSHAELGLVVEPISLCIHETFSLRESVWLCATLGISVKGLHLQCLWCSQLFALFCKGGGVHTVARDNQQPVESAASQARRNCSGTDNELAQFAEVSPATEKGKLWLTRRELPFKLVLWYNQCQWNDSSFMSEKGDGSLLVVCNSDETSPTCIAFFFCPVALFFYSFLKQRAHVCIMSW